MNRSRKSDFERVRSDRRNEVSDDYLEAIADFIRQNGECRGTDLARNFSVKHATVTQTVARLKEAGLVDTQPYGPIRLTRKGQRLARESRERHEVVLSFLLAIGVSEEVAAADAEGIEHHVSGETVERLKAFTRKRPRTSQRKS